MNEQIQEILERSIIKSQDKKLFSIPSEITAYVNMILESAYSSKVIAQCLKSIGWQCSKKPLKRDGKTCRYYFKENLDGTKSFALLKPNDEIGNRMDSTSHQGLNHADTGEDDETLGSIERRFKLARASKEQNLSDIRLAQITTEQIRSEHIKIQLGKERKEYILVSDAINEWNTALNFLKQTLFSLPDRVSTRFASLQDDDQIHTELHHELTDMCERLSRAKDGVLGENQDDQYETQDKISVVDGGTP